MGSETAALRRRRRTQQRAVSRGAGKRAASDRMPKDSRRPRCPDHFRRNRRIEVIRCKAAGVEVNETRRRRTLSGLRRSTEGWLTPGGVSARFGQSSYSYSLMSKARTDACWPYGAYDQPCVNV